MSEARAPSRRRPAHRLPRPVWPPLACPPLCVASRPCSTEQGRTSGPALAPRHHVDAERLTRSTVSSVRRLLPTSQAVPQGAAGGDHLGGRSGLSSPVRARTPSFSTSLTQPSSRSLSSTDGSPAFLSGPPSPTSSGPFTSPPISLSPALGTSSLSLTPPNPRFSSLLTRSTIHVLCVDDNKVNLKVASKMLQRLGYTPHALSSGEEAIALFDQIREAGGPTR